MSIITQIIIGDELLNGKIDDLNLKYLANFILDKPIKLAQAIFVRDEQDDIESALQKSIEMSDVTLITGGLGPTKDDLTKEILCKFFNSKLVEHDKIKSDLLDKYEMLGKNWDLSLNDYHLFPADATYVKNPEGLAPGILFSTGYNGNKRLIFACPGVPREFQKMLTQEIYPCIEKELTLTNNEQEYYHIRTYGIPEEEIFNIRYPKLWEELSKYSEVSSLPTLTGVDISLRLTKDDQLESKKSNIKKIIDSIGLKDHVWHIGAQSLAQVIVDEASQKNLTIAFSESCTGGLSASKITDIAGSSKVFTGSIVAYDNSVKTGILGVKKETIDAHGAVSEECAYEMAFGVKEKLNVDIAISWTGIAGPTGATKNKPVGTVGIGISSHLGTKSKIYNFKGDRIKLKERFSNYGLILLLKEIRSL